MVPAPRYTKTVEVHNKSASSVSVTAHYKDHQGAVEEVTAEVAAGGTHLFPEKTVDQGGWQAVVPISSITTGGHKLDVQVDGVVAQVQVHVQESGALLQATKH